MKTLGTRLRALRQQAGLSQAALAQGLVSKSMISQIEADKARPSQELLAALAQRLSVPLEQLLPVRSETKERLARYKQAQAFLSLCHYQDALPLLLDCLQHPHPDWPLLTVTRQAAECLHRLQRYEEARLHYEMALRLAIRENRPDVVVQTRYLLGQVAYAGGHVHVALHEWMRAYQDLRVATSPDGAELLEDLCLQLAAAYAELDRYAEALRFYMEADRVLQGRSRAASRKRATALQGLGTMSAKLQRYADAEARLLEAEQLYKRLGDHKRLYEVRAGLVTVLREAGRLPEAVRLLEQSLLEVERRALPQQWALLLQEQAQLDRQFGQYDRAIERLRQVLALATNEERFHGSARLLLAELLFEQGDCQAARQEAEHAKELFAATQEEGGLVRTYELLIHMYKQLGDYERASEGVAARNELLDRQLRYKGWVL